MHIIATYKAGPVKRVYKVAYTELDPTAGKLYFWLEDEGDQPNAIDLAKCKDIKINANGGTDPLQDFFNEFALAQPLLEYAAAAETLADRDAYFQAVVAHFTGWAGRAKAELGGAKPCQLVTEYLTGL